MSIEFVDLHHHSEHSLLDGFGTVKAHVARCKELGHAAITMTEHGTLRGILALEAAAKEVGIRPIYGCEFYVTKNHLIRALSPEQIAMVTAGKKGKEATDAKKELASMLGINERRHLVVLAETDEGVRNLIRLSNIANRHGFFHKPRIDLALLEKYSDGLIVNSGCVGSVIAQSALNGDIDRAIDDVLWFQEVFGDRFSLEIQPHPIDIQRKWNKMAVMLSEKFDIPLVASNDSHYPAPDDWRTHDALVAIGHRVQIDSCDRMRYEIETFGLKSADDMIEAFARVHSYIDRATVEAAVERAGEQAARCRGEIWKPKTILLPQVTERDPDKELFDLCLDGWDWRLIEDRADRLELTARDYSARLTHELKVIKKLGFAGYFLVVQDMLSWCRENGIFVGPGRGSSAGSLACYLLGITAIDPIEWGLLFERFLTPGRADYPDIDMDIEITRRYEVFDYLREKYGEEHVAQITTLTRMKGKSAIRDVARAFGLHSSEVDQAAGSIVEELTRDSETGAIESALETDEVFQDFELRNPGLVRTAIALEGHIRQVGIHPAGIVASPIPLTDFVPMERRLIKKREVMVTAYDKYTVPDLGLIKLDILGLKMLSVLGDCARVIEEMTGEVIDFEALTFDDADVLQMFTDGDSVGVFQFDTPTARAACVDVVFDTFEDVIALNALNRPGPAKSGLADEWRSRKLSGKIPKQDPRLAEICSDTLGVIVYQEHVIKILQVIAGYSPAEAGRLRKAISKSAGVGYLEEERPVFVEGSVELGFDEGDANALWTQIEQFGAYGFNKSHSAAYGALAYWCQWAKKYHPAAFFCGLLTHEDQPAEASRVAREASRRGVKIERPNVNVSRGSWTVGPSGALVAGLNMIKGVSENSSIEVQKAQPFESFADFIGRVNRRKVNKGVVVKLAKAGAFSEFVPNLKWFITEYDSVAKLIGKKGWVDKLKELFSESESEEFYNQGDEDALAISVGISGEDPMSVLDDMIRAVIRPRGDWSNVDDVYTGGLIRGVMTAKTIGKSGRSRWAAIEIEGIEGARLRLRMDDAAFQRFRDVLDEPLGTLVAARVSVGMKGGARPALLVNMLEMRRKWREGEDLTWQERSLMRAKEHPAGPGVAKYWQTGKTLIVNVSEKRDKSGRKMAFLSVDGGVGGGDGKEVVVFADVWEETPTIEAGDVIELRGNIDKRGSIIAKSIDK